MGDLGLGLRAFAFCPNDVIDGLSISNTVGNLALFVLFRHGFECHLSHGD